MARDRPERQPQHLRGRGLRARRDHPRRRLRQGDEARGEDRRHRPGGRVVGRARAGRALPLPARRSRADDGATRAIDAVADIHRVFAAFNGGDVRTLHEVIAEDAVWRVPGETLVSRTYDGRREIFELFKETRRLTDGSYRAELQWAAAEGDNAVAVYRACGSRLGRELDIDQVLLIGLRDGRWRQVLALPTDPPAFEAFWGE